MSRPTFAQQLTAFRLKRGMSMNSLSFEAALDHSHISRLEAGKRLPTYASASALATALELTPSERAQFHAAAGLWPDEPEATLRLALADATSAGLLDQAAQYMAKCLLERMLATKEG